MAKKLNLTLVMIITIIFSSCLIAGELTFGWNKMNDTGPINDMQFMPGHDNFIFCTSFDMQIRNTESGELVQSYPFGAFDIEFTPDSTRLIMLAVGGVTGRIEIRNVSDMSLIREYIIPENTDTEGLDIVESGIGFSEMVVDPIRPYVYAIRKRAGTLNGNIYFDIRKIVIYNYETMEEVGVMQNSNGDNLWLQKIAISKDGKYLAVNNGGASYLRVWDLGTRQEIRSYKLCDYIPGSGDDGQPSCTKFSEINSDIIYFSGKFPKSKNVDGIYGLVTYSITENRIVDSTFGIEPNYVSYGKFTFFDNEERAIKGQTHYILILNLKNKTIENKIDRDTITNGLTFWYGNTIYSYNKNLFIGYAGQYYGIFRYNVGTGTIDNFNFDTIIYPNPTDGMIAIENSCIDPVHSYEISDINGLIIIRNTIMTAQSGITTIDISTLSVGTYFLRYYCGSSVTTYKVIKEN